MFELFLITGSIVNSKRFDFLLNKFDQDFEFYKSRLIKSYDTSKCRRLPTDVSFELFCPKKVLISCLAHKFL